MLQCRVKLDPDGRLSVVVYPLRGEKQATPEALDGDLPYSCQYVETRNGQSPRNADAATTSRDTGFTRYGARRVVLACSTMEIITNREECLFVTLTHPGSTFDSFKTLASNSSRLVHGFKAWINKRVPSKLDCYCWEYQKRGALHLHYVVHVPDVAARKYIVKHTRSQWDRQLERLSDETGIDLYERLDGTSWRGCGVTRASAEPVKKSIAGYMSKYLSKSASIEDSASFVAPHPTRYYGISRPLCSAIAEHTAEKAIYCAENDVKARCYIESLIPVLESLSDSGVTEFRPFPRVSSLYASVSSADRQSMFDWIVNAKSKKDFLDMARMSPKEISDNSPEEMIIVARSTALSVSRMLKRSSEYSRRFYICATVEGVRIFCDTAFIREASFGQLASFFNDVVFAIEGHSPDGYGGSSQLINQVLDEAKSGRSMCLGRS